jgi:hypothetical protein
VKKSQPTQKDSKKIKSRSILIGSVVALLIAITPYLFYSYEYFPNGPIFKTWLFTYESKYQESVSLAMWIYLGKLIPLSLLVLWFFTCKHWWYHIILIPMAMYVFQLVSLFVEDTAYFDEVEIYWMIPIMLTIVPFVYLIRLKLFDKHVLGIDLEAMDMELEALKKNKPFDKNAVFEEKAKTVEYLSFSEKLNHWFSTGNLEFIFRQFQNNLKAWLHLNF